MVKIKLNPVSAVVSGKRVVLVDDSIVRGTTSKNIVRLLREAGAREVHMRITSPPFLYPCYYGTDIKSTDKLIARQHNIKEIQEIIGADSLHYLSHKAVRAIAAPIRRKICASLVFRPVPSDIQMTHCVTLCQTTDQGRRIAMKSDSQHYKDAGVDINAGYRAVQLMKDMWNARAFRVLSGLGGFGGLFMPDLSGMKKPVLVSGTDGVGTKLKLAFLMDRYDTIGIDCVAMCVNDIICCGAKPVFLDYLALGRTCPSAWPTLLPAWPRAACRRAAP